MGTVEPETQTKAISARRRIRGLYLSGLALLVFAALSLAVSVLRVPSRSGTIDLAGRQVKITVSMLPDPPKTGPIPVQVVITDDSGSPATVDQVIVRYGMVKQMSAEAIATPAASRGAYRAQIKFANVGKGWIEIAMRRGNARGQLRFPVDVRPNI